MKFLPVTRAMIADDPARPALGFGIAWDPEWVGPDRLVIRGYRAAQSWPKIARSEFAALVATTDATLADAGWTEFERHAVRRVLAYLYEEDLPELKA